MKKIKWRENIRMIVNCNRIYCFHCCIMSGSLLVKRLSANAVLPYRASDGSAGYDLSR